MQALRVERFFGSNPPPGPRVRSLRVAVACARALLDELDTELGEPGEDQTTRDVIAQVADERERVAKAMKRWAVNDLEAVRTPSQRRLRIGDMWPGQS